MGTLRFETLTRTIPRGRFSRRGALRQFGAGGLAAALGGAAGSLRPRSAAADESDDGEGSPGEVKSTPAGDFVVPTATRETLPAPDLDTPGRLRLLEDYDRNVWLDTGAGWLSTRGEVFDVRSFGATGDGTTDDWAAFTTAIEAMTTALDPDTNAPHGQTLFVPPGRYRLSQTLILDRSVRLVGASTGGRFSDAVLLVDPGLVGVLVAAGEPILTGSPGRRGDGTIIERLRIEAIPAEGDAGPDEAHGIWVQAPATIRDCSVAGFGGDGIRVEAASAEATVAGWRVAAGDVASCAGSGLHARGAGTTAGVCAALTATDNGAWGILDEATPGNTYLHCRADDNVTGPFSAAGPTNRSAFLGCAMRGGAGRATFGDQTLVVGGDYLSGFQGGNAWTAAGSRMTLIGQAPGTGETSLPTVPTLRLHAGDRQSQPHLRVSDLRGDRLLELDVAGRLFVGPFDPALAADTPPGGELPLLHLSDAGDGRAGIRWAVLGEFDGWVAQVRAVREVLPDAPQDFAGGRLTFQTPDGDGNAIDTLTLRGGRVGVGTVGPAPSAALEVASIAQGFLPPRLTTDQRDAVAAPAEGLLIYNTTTKRLNFYDGEAWQEVGLSAIGG